MSLPPHPGSAPRSVLCVPASDHGKVAKALQSGADEVVLDLEDAVAPADKRAARDALAHLDLTAADGSRVAVRVNAPRTPWCHGDLIAVAALDAVTGVVVPKVESRADVGFVERLLDGAEAEADVRRRLGVQALIETAAGVTHVDEIVADRDRLEALIVGYADLAASTGRAPGLPGGWWGVQDRIVLAARTGDVRAVDGPFLGTADDEAFRTAVDEAVALGFDAKWVIHPRQIDTVTTAFAPSNDAVDHARAVLDALDAAHADGRGAVALDGQLVDEAMAVAARRVLAKVAR